MSIVNQVFINMVVMSQFPRNFRHSELILEVILKKH